MEQKKVQRTIGILVVIALVIVVMPLLFGKNNFPMQQAANIKAPPFPDQPQSVTDQPKTEVAANADLPKPPALSGQIPDKQSVEVTPEIAKKVNDDSEAAAANSPSATDNKPAPAVGTIIYEPASVSTEAAAPVPAPASPSATPAPISAAPAVSTASAPAPIAEDIKKPAEQITPQVPVVIPPVAKVKSFHQKSQQIIHAKTKPILSHDQFKQSGWVVQMGNFAVKKNAVHLANTLQAAGYKAFTKEIKNSKGNVYTRVYIGPELKQASASQLSNEIHHKLNLQGFVVSYKA